MNVEISQAEVVNPKRIRNFKAKVFGCLKRRYIDIAIDRKQLIRY